MVEVVVVAVVAVVVVVEVVVVVVVAVVVVVEVVGMVVDSAELFVCHDLCPASKHLELNFLLAAADLIWQYCEPFLETKQ